LQIVTSNPQNAFPQEIAALPVTFTFMELTQEHFDQAIAGLATRADISEIRADVAATKAGMANFATTDDLAKIKSELATIKDTLHTHGSMLDTIVKSTADWNTEMTVMRSRMERYEFALKTVGEKLNIDLSAFFH
jgi:hypothetical protein